MNTIDEEQRAADDRETVRLINELRAGNGRLGIFTDCRGGKGVVVVWAQGGDPELRFYSNRLLGCLHKAVAEKRKTLDGRENQD